MSQDLLPSSLSREEEKCHNKVNPIYCLKVADWLWENRHERKGRTGTALIYYIKGCHLYNAIGDDSKLSCRKATRMLLDAPKDYYIEGQSSYALGCELYDRAPDPRIEKWDEICRTHRYNAQNQRNSHQNSTSSSSRNYPSGSGGVRSGRENAIQNRNSESHTTYNSNSPTGCGRYYWSGPSLRKSQLGPGEKGIVDFGKNIINQSGATVIVMWDAEIYIDKKRIGSYSSENLRLFRGQSGQGGTFFFDTPRPGGSYSVGGVTRAGKGPLGRTVRGRVIVKLYCVGNNGKQELERRTVQFTVSGQ